LLKYCVPVPLAIVVTNTVQKVYTDGEEYHESEANVQTERAQEAGQVSHRLLADIRQSSNHLLEENQNC
jgi:hypothetical protein